MVYPQLLFRCLNCRNELSRRSGDEGFLYRCDSCHSYAASVPLLRRVLPLPMINRVWREAMPGPSSSGRECPLCSRQMAPHRSHQGNVLEVCRSCRIVWFDPGDFPGNLADLEKAFRRDELSPRARQALAMGKVELLRQRAEAEEARDGLRDAVLRGATRSLFRSFFRL